MDERRARAEAIEDFAEVLRELRNSVGNPSFREMSGRSGAISHTTLHEATKGNRLPSWGTTAEFIKACGKDPEAFRERWEQANQAVRIATSGGQPSPAVHMESPLVSDASAAASTPPAPPGEPAAMPPPPVPSQRPDDASASVPSLTQPSAPATASMPVPAQPPGEIPSQPPGGIPPQSVGGFPTQPVGGLPATVHPSSHPTAGSAQYLPGGIGGEVQQVGAPPAQGHKRMLVYVAAAAIVAGATGAIIYAVTTGGGDGKPDTRGLNPSGSPSEIAFGEYGCPIRPSQPAYKPPLHKGDAAAFVDDITLRDCTRVATRKTVVKVWRIRNTGKRYWHGYSLSRLDLPQKSTDCQTKNRVPINPTRPGETVDIQVEVTTPVTPGLCYARFKMLDSAGHVAFSGNRPVNFQLVVHDQ